MFDKIFWAFPSCVEAFKHCKPFISVDGTYLYDKYAGELLIVVAQDGNSNILLVAFAIVDSETTESCSSKARYKWYMNALTGLSREMAELASRFNKKIWLQHCDQSPVQTDDNEPLRVHECYA
ncbi:uncharacterized protein LOC107636551 [Arachis ipaensis]|uniref:uncharacterized protein LOC107636551 n=1 Tax=Arachis ipaensis TaxID=130454 RepID=UPI0007AF8E84|nr:uncharacterized protein LOC107636551 [Arachis ipaensis]